tara:strand:- start:4690 stop:5712 length:1023 start_codon:yes stop_codon:yes gene_type:complete
MIIIKSKKQSKFEDDYLKSFIFGDNENIYTSPKDFFLLDEKTISSNRIIIYYSIGNPSLEKEINEFINELKMEYILIQLSDETLIGKKIKNKNTKIIFRSYFNPNTVNSKTFTIPLGYQNGFQEEEKIANLDRKYIWSFFGQIYSSREIMINSLNEIYPHFVHQNQSFMSEDALQPAEIKNIYKNTIFAPCPDGYVNPDTFRIMEVLESGCIPIVKKFNSIDYFKYVYGDHPFIVVNKWNDVNKVIKKYINDKELLNNKQNEIVLWYQAYKKNLKIDIQDIIKNNITQPASVQFKYQKKARFNVMLRLRFLKWFRLRQNPLYYKVSKFFYKTKKALKGKF